MGFFSKLFKGLKKVVKKIGKGIKSAFKGIGKFMGKIGIVGQIALGLILPPIALELGAWAGTTLAAGSTAGTVAKAAASFVNAAINVGTKVGSVFNTVSSGVTKVVGDVAGAVLNKIPGAADLVQNVTKNLGFNQGKGIDISKKFFTGDKGILKTAQTALTDTVRAGQDLFSMDTLTGDNKFYLESLEKSTGSVEGDSVNTGKIDDIPEPQEQTKDIEEVKATSPSILSKPDTVSPTKDEYSFFDEASKKIKEEGEDFVAGTAINKVAEAVGLKDKPSSGESTLFSSNVMLGPMSSASIGDSTIMSTDPMQDILSGSYVLDGMFGHPSMIYNAQQNELAKAQVQQRGGF